GRILAGPDLSHPFGSDALGRDVFSRVLFAYRVSLAVAIGSVLLALVVGVPLGLIAGYFGGPVDSLLMRPVHLLLALPALLLAPCADIFPGLAIAIAVLAFILIGDGTRAHFDPHGVSR